MDHNTLSQFRSGDEAAVRAVYRRYGRMVYVIALRVVHHRDLAEEATQTTFVKAWKASATFDPTRNPGPWLATIARRTAIDIGRREARHNALPIHGSAGEITALTGYEDPDLARADTVRAVREALDQLADDERTIARMQHFEGLSHREIAAKLGIPVGTVKSRSHRTHRHLATALDYLRDPNFHRSAEPTGDVG